MIKRRHVFYIEGYDPRGAIGYHHMFAREWPRSLKIWGFRGHLSDVTIDSDEFAHWEIETHGPNWQVWTRYEFLRLDPFMRASLNAPLIRHIGRGLAWIVDDLVSGTMFRMLRVAWRFALHLLVAQILLLAWLAAAVAAGLLVVLAAVQLTRLETLLVAPVALVASCAVFAALRPLAKRLFVMRLIDGWPNLRRYGRGKPTGYDQPIEACAQRLVAAARMAGIDEIVLVSHSAGCAVSPPIIARALEIDPQIGCHGPRLVLLTLASLMPAVALHPSATKLRSAVRRLATEPSLLWIDVQARKDPMNFWDFDPVAGIGIDVGALRCNPTVWTVRIRDMLSDHTYESLRFNYFRLHYQFIMGNHRRADYDYFMLICGPAALSDWAKNPHRVTSAFGPDGAVLDACSPFTPLPS
jgi:hypothetical protein